MKKLILLMLAVTFATSALADVVVIVNAENSVSSLKKSELSRIFMGKVRAFDHGGKATAVNQIGASDARSSFDSDLLGKTTSQINAYWSKQMFSGGGTPPEELSGDLAVLKYVSENQEAIGYVDREVVNGAVKVVEIN